MGPWFDAHAKAQSLIEDQYRRKTSAARLGYELHHLQDDNPLVSPSLADENVVQAKKSPCEERAPRPAPAPAPRPAFWVQIFRMFAWLRCRLAAGA